MAASDENGDMVTPLLLALSGNHGPFVERLLTSEAGLRTVLDLTFQVVKYKDFGPGYVFRYCRQERPRYLPLLRTYQAAWFRQSRGMIIFGQSLGKKGHPL